jgi:KDO2-lipid IV(A) lauroyltransferase
LASAATITDAAVDAGLLAFEAGTRALTALPRRLLLRIGSALGDLLYATWATRRRYVLNNLVLAFGAEKPPAELIAIARASYRHFGQGLLEVIASMHTSPACIDRIVRVQDRRHVEAAFARGKGVVVISAHIGNWEICACKQGVFPRVVSALARPPRNARVARFMLRTRRFPDVRVIPTGATFRALREMLLAGEGVIFLLDINAGKQGTFVEFFGRFASTHRGPAGLALETGAEIIIATARRCPDSTHMWSYLQPFTLVRTGDRERDLLRNTAAITKIIEQEIRKRPDQYYWFHRRWKQRPEWEMRPSPTRTELGSGPEGP